MLVNAAPGGPCVDGARALEAGPRQTGERRCDPVAIDEQTARRVAHLARIEVAEADLAPLARELSAILGFMEQLSAVDVEGVEPMTSVTPMAMDWRADAVTEGGDRTRILANAPAARDGFFTVPKVVE